MVPSCFAPERIDGLVMFAEDAAWPVYFEKISFDSSGRFNAEITNGSDNLRLRKLLLHQNRRKYGRVNLFSRRWFSFL